MNKQISISGTGNRYKMKKVLHQDRKEPKEKINLLECLEYTQEENQKCIDSLEDLDYFKKENITLYQHLIKNIITKISGYRAQDIRKKVYNKEEIVTLETIINLWKTNKLMCYYCQETCLIFNKIVREPKQWTLDRIDNSIGHNENNILLSCLQCNIKRRNKDKDKFFQGSNFNLIKLN